MSRKLGGISWFVERSGFRLYKKLCESFVIFCREPIYSYTGRVFNKHSLRLIVIRVRTKIYIRELALGVMIAHF